MTQASGWKSFEGVAHLIETADRRPGLDAEVRLGRARDEIQLVAARVDLVADDVPILAPPLDPVVDCGRKPFGPIDRTIRDLPRKVRLDSPEYEIEHGGMHAVGSDHGIGFDARAVRKGKLHPRVGAVDADELLVEPHDVRRINRRERGVKIGAMERNIRRAEALLDRISHRMKVGDLAGIPYAVVADLRRKAGAADAIFEAKPAEQLHGVRVQLNAGADARERVGLLVDHRRDADLAQGCGRGQPGNARADDGYRRFARHAFVRTSHFETTKR